MGDQARLRSSRHPLVSTDMTEMLTDFGPQYRLDDDFKRRARLHQSRFRALTLGLPECRGYGNRLCTVDALAGKNFHPWPGMLAAIERRYGRADTKLTFDMLRSEHIPFNFFVPLREQATMMLLAQEWTGVEIARILSVEIEWAPTPKAGFLDDNTSFDAYVEYLAKDDTRGAIGIEVKFTEREYPWGKTEQKRMFDSHSRYLVVHEASGIYVAGTLEFLRTLRLKQLWRNQLLGEAMLQFPKLGFAHFTSVLLYPKGNSHFVEVTHEYEKLLAPARASATFRAVTFENFIARCREHARTPEDRAWGDYLAGRYLVD
jgi:hypothetical protein